MNAGRVLLVNSKPGSRTKPLLFTLLVLDLIFFHILGPFGTIFAPYIQTRHLFLYQYANQPKSLRLKTLYQRFLCLNLFDFILDPLKPNDQISNMQINPNPIANEIPKENIKNKSNCESEILLFFWIYINWIQVNPI